MTAHTRRHFLRTVAAGAAAVTLPGWLHGQAADDRTVTISVLHTTDLHGHILPTKARSGDADVGGLARCAFAIRLWRRENPLHITIDAGDLYQGTHAGWRTRGRLMVDALNLLGYDAWVIGNHEFDWGIDPLVDATARSRMPVLCANARLEPGLRDRLRIAPYLLKEVGGFRIGVVGVTTPGLSFWLPDQLLGGFSATDPVGPVRGALHELAAAKADAVVLVAHMGLREAGDDFANRIQALCAEFPEIAVAIGGHTHRNLAIRRSGTVLYTQADYWGIHAGRVDLTFDRDSRQLVNIAPRTVLMDRIYDMDAAVLSLAAPDLEDSRRALETVVCTIGRPLRARPADGGPGDIEPLIAAALTSALAGRGVTVDGVLHGRFSDTDVPAGNLTVADLWSIIPFENQVVTADLLPSDLIAIMDEIAVSSRNEIDRRLIGFEVVSTVEDGRRRVRTLMLPDGRPLDPARRYRIAMNSYDAQSGGRRMMVLRALMELRASQATFHPVGTRDALAAYLTARYPQPAQPAS